MKIPKSYYLVLLFIFNYLTAGQISYLSSGDASIELSENQAIKILKISYSSHGENDGISIQRDSITYHKRSDNVHDIGSSIYGDEYIIIGPANISLYKNWNGNYPTVVYEKFNINGNNPLILSIPENIPTAEVIVEASTDSATWDEVFSSSLSGGIKQFIRVSVQ